MNYNISQNKYPAMIIYGWHRYNACFLQYYMSYLLFFSFFLFIYMAGAISCSVTSLLPISWMVIQGGILKQFGLLEVTFSF